jgi:DNA-binding FadR family transcriptional regulator
VRGSAGGYEVLEIPSPSQRAGPSLDSHIAEFDALLEFRLAIEGATVSRAARRRDNTDLRRMEQAHSELKMTVSLASFRRADSLFHLAIAEAAKNHLLFQAVYEARAAMFLPMDAVGPDINVETTLKGHADILAAIEARNPVAARQALARHLAVARREVRRAALRSNNSMEARKQLGAKWPIRHRVDT